MPEPATTSKERSPGNRIKQLRLSRGYSAQKLADEMGIGRSILVKLERGERRLNSTWMRRIADVLDVAPQAILQEDEPRLVWAPQLKPRDTLKWLKNAGNPNKIPVDTEFLPVAYTRESVLAFDYLEPGLLEPEKVVVDYLDTNLVNRGYYLITIDTEFRTSNLSSLNVDLQDVVIVRRYIEGDGPPRLVSSIDESKGMLDPIKVLVLGRVIMICRLL